MLLPLGTRGQEVSNAPLCQYDVRHLPLINSSRKAGVNHDCFSEDRFDVGPAFRPRAASDGPGSGGHRQTATVLQWRQAQYLGRRGPLPRSRGDWGTVAPRGLLLLATGHVAEAARDSNRSCVGAKPTPTRRSQTVSEAGTAQTSIDVRKNFVPYSGCPQPRSRRRHPDARPPRIGAQNLTGPCVRGLTDQSGRDLSSRCLPPPAEFVEAHHASAPNTPRIERVRAAGPARGAVERPFCRLRGTQRLRAAAR